MHYIVFLMAQLDPHYWAHYLPLILLSIRNISKHALSYSSAELTFNTIL